LVERKGSGSTVVSGASGPGSGSAGPGAGASPPRVRGLAGESGASAQA
ncbi:response regulator, partial [Streptomyces sp. SID5926]|nr:response regulator [Streptomyces sp. SID5926]